MNAFKKFQASKIQNKAIQFLADIRKEIGLLEYCPESANIKPTVRRLALEPLGNENKAFPAGYFDSFLG